MRLAKPLLVMALFGLAPSLMGDMRQDEFLCEEAHTHLVDCCPGFATNDGYYCDYSAPGCDSGTVYPVLTVDESNCIRGLSCSELVSRGVCERAAAAKSSRYNGAGPGTGTGTAGVCP